MLLIVWLNFLNKKKNIIITVTFYILGFLLQISTVILYQLSFINNTFRIHLFFFSLLFAIVGDISLSKMVPDNLKIFKYILYYHAGFALIGNIVYWIWVLISSL